MVNFTGSNGIELNHLVIFEDDNKIFVAGRERFNKRLRIFLINEHTGEVYTRNGRAANWAVVDNESNRRSIADNVYDACRRRNIPVYRVKGQFCG
jgi:siroheme synthase (precorrin-2 oxidase/ferrochelatase)